MIIDYVNRYQIEMGNCRSSGHILITKQWVQNNFHQTISALLCKWSYIFSSWFKEKITALSSLYPTLLTASYILSHGGVPRIVDFSSGRYFASSILVCRSSDVVPWIDKKNIHNYSTDQTLYLIKLSQAKVNAKYKWQLISRAHFS
jgi:hypothetical protein